MVNNITTPTHIMVVVVLCMDTLVQSHHIEFSVLKRTLSKREKYWLQLIPMTHTFLTIILLLMRVTISLKWI